MTKLLARLALVLGACLGGALPSPAAAQGRPSGVVGTPDSYVVTVNEFSLCADADCTGKTTVISGAQQFDIAGVGANASAGDYVPAGATVPPGTYSHFRIGIGQTIQVAGRLEEVTGDGPGHDCITANRAAGKDGGVRAEGEEGGAADSPATTTFTIPAQNGDAEPVRFVSSGGQISITVEFAAPVTVTAGEAMPSFAVNFDVADSISGIQTSPNTCDIVLGQPSLKVVVGGVMLADIDFR